MSTIINKKQIKCAVFDLDGTLLNTIHTINYYLNLALERNGLGKIDKDKNAISFDKLPLFSRFSTDMLIYGGVSPLRHTAKTAVPALPRNGGFILPQGDQQHSPPLRLTL